MSLTFEKLAYLSRFSLDLKKLMNASISKLCPVVLLVIECLSVKIIGCNVVQYETFRMEILHRLIKRQEVL